MATKERKKAASELYVDNTFTNEDLDKIQAKVLDYVSTQDMPPERAGELIGQIGKLKTDRAPKPERGEVYFKISEKGACSVYGLQRMPVTLYIDQWERVGQHLFGATAFADTPIGQFETKNPGKLKRKPKGEVAA